MNVIVISNRSTGHNHGDIVKCNPNDYNATHPF